MVILGQFSVGLFDFVETTSRLRSRQTVDYIKSNSIFFGHFDRDGETFIVWLDEDNSASAVLLSGRGIGGLKPP